MSKNLLLFAFIAMVCVGCNSKSNQTTPEAPEKPDTLALGYIDLAHWNKIINKDAATIQPQLKGVMLRDTIISTISSYDSTRYNQRVLVYKQNADLGTLITSYHFDREGLLEQILSVTDSTETLSITDLHKHSKAISDQMHQFITSFEGRGEFGTFMFDVFNNGKYDKGFMNQNLQQGQEPYSGLWAYADRKFKKGFADNETFYCLQMWNLVDDVDFPNATTHRTRSNIMFGTTDVTKRTYIDIQFIRAKGTL